ncbi:NAD(P)-binding protein [Hypoxylon sp. NC0597]|nr:NAD(P)-binding protein [Hypoxylon sp. NC0597]
MTATIFITGDTSPIGFRILLEALAAGHNVRYAVRSKENAQSISGNPKIQARNLGDRLLPFIIPDFTVKGAFDIALQGVTHIIHIGPFLSTHDPNKVFQTVVKAYEEILSSALKMPSIQRIVLTSSIIENADLVSVSRASTQLPPSSSILSSFNDVRKAFTTAKVVALERAEEFVATHKPHFTISRVVVGHVVGHNELILDAEMVTKQGSRNFLMMVILDMEVPSPIPGAYAHIDDVAEVHLRVAFLDPKAGGPKDFGVATKVDYSGIFDIIKREFPKEVADGLFKERKFDIFPIDYDSSETEKLLGRKLKSFECAVVDMVREYIEHLERSKAATTTYELPIRSA